MVPSADMSAEMFVPWATKTCANSGSAVSTATSSPRVRKQRKQSGTVSGQLLEMTPLTLKTELNRLATYLAVLNVGLVAAR